MNTRAISDNWYESFFEGINCELWEKAVTPEWTEMEAEFLIDVLSVNPGAHLLDMPCGNGRHVLALAQKGFRMTGVDISKDFLDSLARQMEGKNLPITAIHADILRVELSESFDGAYCLGNSFGYFSYKGMQQFIEKVAAALQAGARWVIHTGMIAESILPNFSAQEVFEVEDIKMEISNSYVAEEGYMTSRLVYTQGDQVKRDAFKHHVYTLAELIRLLKERGLKTLATYGSTQKDPYKLGDHQLYLVAEKI